MEGKGKGRFSFVRVEEGGLYPVGLIEHVPPLKVGIVAELLVEFCTCGEGAILVAEAEDTMDDELCVSMVGDELVNGWEVLEECCLVVVDEGIQ